MDLSEKGIKKAGRKRKRRLSGRNIFSAFLIVLLLASSFLGTLSVYAADKAPVPDSVETFVLNDDSTDSSDEVIAQYTADNIPVITIGNQPLPLSSGTLSGFVWALTNLVFATAGMLLALAAASRAFMHRRKRTGTIRVKRTFLLLVFATILMGAAGGTVFLLTQDTALTMVLTDPWTIMHLALFAAEITGFMCAFKQKKLIYLKSL